MTYRPAEIEIRGRCWPSYMAYLVLRDDGIDSDGSDQGVRGFDLEQGPYLGLTHRRAWRRAWKAAGRRLWDVPRETAHVPAHETTQHGP